MIRDIAAERLRAVPILQVAGRVATIGRLNRQRVVVIDVARDAGSRRRRNVHAGQRKTGHAVIKGAQIRPRDGVMALRAIRSRESRAGGSVRRVIRLLPGGQVAACVAAIGGRDLEIVVVVDVALRASNSGVAVGQRKPCAGVIEGRGIPTRCVMAVAAARQREGLRGIGVRRIVGLLPGAEVAAGVAAVRVGNALEIVIVVDMALRAGQRGVRAIQNESGHTVIERSAEPTIKTGVAILAIGGGKGRACARVWRIVGLLPIG